MEEWIETLNKPKNRFWIELCKMDLDAFYEIQFNGPLLIIEHTERMLKELECLIDAKGTDRKEIYDLMRKEVLLSLKSIRDCREALEFLDERKYLSQKETRDFQKKFTSMEDLLLEYAKRYAKGVTH